MKVNGHDKGLEALKSTAALVREPQDPTAVLKSPEELIQEATERRQKELSAALQTDIQATCARHSLDPLTTISSITAALGILILLNVDTPEGAAEIRRNIRQELKKIVTRNWEAMQPIKAKFLEQLAEQMKAAQNATIGERSGESTEEPAQEDPAGGDVRSDSTG